MIYNEKLRIFLSKPWFPQHSKMPQALIGVAKQISSQKFCEQGYINHHRERNGDKVLEDFELRNM
jgi:hypothetical protein